MQRFGKLGLLVALGLTMVGAATVEAGPRYGGRGRGYSYGSRPIYHQPSFHYDYVRHDRLHWTPWEGLHIDRHYHQIPHFVPGHFDQEHHGHVHENPWFHH